MLLVGINTRSTTSKIVVWLVEFNAHITTLFLFLSFLVLFLGAPLFTVTQRGSVCVLFNFHLVLASSSFAPIMGVSTQGQA